MAIIQNVGAKTFLRDLRVKCRIKVFSRVIATHLVSTWHSATIPTRFVCEQEIVYLERLLQWRVKRKMLHKRLRWGVATLGRIVYIFGGCTEMMNCQTQ